MCDLPSKNDLKLLGCTAYTCSSDGLPKHLNPQQRMILQLYARRVLTPTHPELGQQGRTLLTERWTEVEQRALIKGLEMHGTRWKVRTNLDDVR